MALMERSCLPRARASEEKKNPVIWIPNKHIITIGQQVQPTSSTAEQIQTQINFSEALRTTVFSVNCFFRRFSRTHAHSLVSWLAPTSSTHQFPCPTHLKAFVKDGNLSIYQKTIILFWTPDHRLENIVVAWVQLPWALIVKKLWARW